MPLTLRALKTIPLLKTINFVTKFKNNFCSEFGHKIKYNKIYTFKNNLQIKVVYLPKGIKYYSYNINLKP